LIAPDASRQLGEGSLVQRPVEERRVGERAQDFDLRRELPLQENRDALDVIERLALDGLLLVAQPRGPERRRQRDQGQQSGKDEQEERATSADGMRLGESGD
jgi:hypothetical protein